jgi:hypothetical protein
MMMSILISPLQGLTHLGFQTQGVALGYVISPRWGWQRNDYSAIPPLGTETPVPAATVFMRASTSTVARRSTATAEMQPMVLHPHGAGAGYLLNS